MSANHYNHEHHANHDNTTQKRSAKVDDDEDEALMRQTTMTTENTRTPRITQRKADDEMQWNEKKVPELFRGGKERRKSITFIFYEEPM